MTVVFFMEGGGGGSLRQYLSVSDISKATRGSYWMFFVLYYSSNIANWFFFEKQIQGHLFLQRDA
jgi:hypothetical protein